MAPIYETYPGLTSQHSIHRVVSSLASMYKGAAEYHDSAYNRKRMAIARRISRAYSDKVNETTVRAHWKKDHGGRYDGTNVYAYPRDVYAAAYCGNLLSDRLTLPIGQKGFDCDYYHRNPSATRYSTTVNLLRRIDDFQADIKRRQYWEQEYVPVYHLRTTPAPARYAEVTF